MHTHTVADDSHVDYSSILQIKADYLLRQISNKLGVEENYHILTGSQILASDLPIVANMLEKGILRVVVSVCMYVFCICVCMCVCTWKTTNILTGSQILASDLSIAANMLEKGSGEWHIFSRAFVYLCMYVCRKLPHSYGVSDSCECATCIHTYTHTHIHKYSYTQVDRVYPLSDICKAHELSESHHAVGESLVCVCVCMYACMYAKHIS
jgi:hypothetical protein